MERDYRHYAEHCVFEKSEGHVLSILHLVEKPFNLKSHMCFHSSIKTAKSDNETIVSVTILLLRGSSYA